VFEVKLSTSLSISRGIPHNEMGNNVFTGNIPQSVNYEKRHSALASPLDKTGRNDRNNIQRKAFHR
jgi:hypothetical protein